MIILALIILGVTLLINIVVWREGLKFLQHCKTQHDASIDELQKLKDKFLKQQQESFKGEA